MNIASGVLISYSIKDYLQPNYKAISISAFVFCLPLLASAAFLSDAFRRFKNLKRSEQVIDNFIAGSLTIGFLLYSLSLTVDKLIALFDIKNIEAIYKTTYYSYEVIVISFWSSNLLLAFVLNKLIID